ncbi:MAG: radical SAM protein [archaeon]|jgi:radical SAM protein with 4Fe4S-binding SPASM domain|nr:radical SAM protein [archaeon]
MYLEKPVELQIELTQRCNYNCGFCFNQNAHGSGPELGFEQVKKVIYKACEAGIERVRFTGGEPLLRSDIFQILEYTKGKGLYVLLNTNASLVDAEAVAKIEASVDNVLVSLHAFDEDSEAKLSGGKGAFEKKISAIKMLAEKKILLRVGTILSKENIKNLEKFHELVLKLGLKNWALFRPIPSPQNKQPVSREEIELVVEKINKINQAGGSDFLIENALPFCCCEPEDAKRAAVGGANDDGHTKLAVDCEGRIKPSYFLDQELGSVLEVSFKEAWESDFMKRLHGLEFIAEPCHKCRFVAACRGGSRFSALLCTGSLYSLDPLADPEKYWGKLEGKSG